MTRLPSRTRPHVRVYWKEAVVTALLAVLMAFAVSWPVMLLIGAAHAADPAVPPLGWSATFRGVLAVWFVSWVPKTGARMDA